MPAAPGRSGAVPIQLLEVAALRRGNQRGAALEADAGNHPLRVGRQIAGDQRDSRLDDAGFLEGDRLQTVAELRLMVEVDRGDRRRRSASTTLVASSRPPRPTSSTATSTPASRKRSKAMAVAHSKNVGGASRRAVALQGFDRLTDPLDGSSEPRRVHLAIADDDSAPRDARDAARCSARRGARPPAAPRWTMAVTEPLPLVPAIMIELNDRSGWPSAAQSLEMFSRPNFIPRRSRLKR